MLCYTNEKATLRQQVLLTKPVVSVAFQKRIEVFALFFSFRRCAGSYFGLKLNLEFSIKLSIPWDIDAGFPVREFEHPVNVVGGGGDGGVNRLTHII